MCRCGTSGHGLADMVVLGWWLDLMILEVFSNLNDSIILCCGGYGCVSHRSSPLLCWFFQLLLSCTWKSKSWEGMNKVSLRCACAVQNGGETPAKAGTGWTPGAVHRTRWGWSIVRLDLEIFPAARWDDPGMNFWLQWETCSYKTSMVLCILTPGRNPQRSASAKVSSASTLQFDPFGVPCSLGEQKM